MTGDNSAGSLGPFLESLSADGAGEDKRWAEDFDLASASRLEGDEAQQALRLLLAYDPADVRVPRALGVLGIAEARAALIGCLSPNRPEPVRAEAAAVLWTESRDQRALHVFREILSTQGSGQAKVIALATIRDEPPSELLTLVRQCLGHPSQSVRLNSAWALRRSLPPSFHGGAPRVDLLQARLGSPSKLARSLALQDLDEIQRRLLAGEPASDWLETPREPGPIYGEFLGMLRNHGPNAQPFQAARLALLSGYYREKVVHMLFAAFHRGDPRAAPCLQHLGYSVP